MRTDERLYYRVAAAPYRACNFIRQYLNYPGSSRKRAFNLILYSE